MRALLRFFGLADDRHHDRSAPAPAATPTTLGPGIKIKGELHGDGTLVVLGFFEGDIVLNGTLEVGADGRIEGNATARAIVVAGVVRGNLSADTRVDILPTGSLYEGALVVLVEVRRLKLRALGDVDPAAMRANHTNLE